MLHRAFYRSHLRVEPKLTLLLTKIKNLYASKKTACDIEFGGVKYKGVSLVSLVIEPANAVGTIVFDDGSGPKTFDKADIQIIQRTRSRKYKIVIKQSANPA